MGLKNILIVIPAYNEEKSLQSVIRDIRENGYNNILVVDDGSSDRTFETADKLNVYTARLIFNRGAGSASATGFAIAKILNPDIVVTFDGDGQHDASDIAKLIEPIIKDEADVVIGSRLLSKRGMPWRRKIYNRLANIVTFMLYGIYASDTQSGFKAFSKKAYNLIDIESYRMEFCSEIIYKIKLHNLRFSEVEVKAIYTPYSLSKGQGFRVGIGTMRGLLINRLLRR